MNSTLSILLKAFPHPVSGEQIAMSNGLSRTAVWKQIQSLQKLGLKIEGKQNSGYRLLEWPDLLLPEIMAYYRRGQLGHPVYWQHELASTNTAAKELARQGAAHGTLVVSESQTAGRGRRGRSWLSPPSEGIFASLILRPAIPTRRVPLLTLATGVALAEALQSFGLREAWLKWPNDIWVGTRKLAGILSEFSGELDAMDFVVVGMGINMHQTEFPPEIAHSATSFLQETGQRINRAQLLSRALAELERVLPLLEQTDVTPLFAAWQKHDRLLGQEVCVFETVGTHYIGRALGLDESGALRVALPDGTERLVLAGDVSIRLPNHT